MARKRMTAGDVRFRLSKIDLERLEWLIDNHPDDHHTVSALMRSLISKEYARYMSVSFNASTKEK